MQVAQAKREIFRATLPIELTNGNAGRGFHWQASHKRRKEIEDLLSVKGFRREPFDVGVVLWVIRIMGPNQRLFDHSSLARGNWKEIEDALVALGWFVDDAPKYINEVRFFQDQSRRADGPATEVVVFEGEWT